jgi:hypothetical protein
MLRAQDGDFSILADGGNQVAGASKTVARTVDKKYL